MWNKIFCFNLDSSGSASFNLETFKKSLFSNKSIQIGVSYYLYVLDVNYKVHGTLIKFKFANFKEKDELVVNLYNKVYKRIYNSKGNQIKTWEKYKKDLFGNMKYDNIVIIMIEASPTDMINRLNNYTFTFYIIKFMIVCCIFTDYIYNKYINTGNYNFLDGILNHKLWLYLLLGLLLLLFYGVYIDEWDIVTKLDNHHHNTLYYLDYNILNNIKKVRLTSPILYMNYVISYNKINWTKSHRRLSKFIPLFSIEKDKKLLNILYKSIDTHTKKKPSISERMTRLIYPDYMSNILNYMVNKKKGIVV